MGVLGTSYVPCGKVGFNISHAGVGPSGPCGIIGLRRLVPNSSGFVHDSSVTIPADHENSWSLDMY